MRRRRREIPQYIKRRDDRPLVMAHRGASRYHEENTWTAIDAALEMGADGIEIDVRRTGDGVPVLAHDPHLARTHGERIIIADQTAAALPLPRLETILRQLAEKWPKVLLDLELKSHKEPLGTLQPDKLGQIIDDAGWKGPTIITSFDTRTVRSYAREGWTTGLLEGERHLRAPTAASLLAQYEADILALRDPGHYRSVREAVHDAGAALWVWTLNRSARIKVARRFQVDAILTDVPDHAFDVLQSVNEPPEAASNEDTQQAQDARDSPSSQ
jgi:glycerophosphoryl diester phosphodiesterase